MLLVLLKTRIWMLSTPLSTNKFEKVSLKIFRDNIMSFFTLN